MQHSHYRPLSPNHVFRRLLDGELRQCISNQALSDHERHHPQKPVSSKIASRSSTRMVGRPSRVACRAEPPVVPPGGILRGESLPQGSLEPSGFVGKDSAGQANMYPVMVRGGHGRMGMGCARGRVSRVDMIYTCKLLRQDAHGMLLRKPSSFPGALWLTTPRPRLDRPRPMRPEVHRTAPRPPPPTSSSPSARPPWPWVPSLSASRWPQVRNQAWIPVDWRSVFDCTAVPVPTWIFC